MDVRILFVEEISNWVRNYPKTQRAAEEMLIWSKFPEYKERIHIAEYHV